MSHLGPVVRRMGMTTTWDALIVGGGYAGVIAANRLSARGHRVALMSDTDRFVDRIRLHQLAAGSRTRTTRPLSSMLRARVRLWTGRVVDVHQGVARLADGRTVAARQVLWATGSRPKGAAGVPAGSLAGAAEARRRLAELGPGARVAVLGGGLTGIETATEVAETHPRLRVRLVDRGEAWLPDAAGDHLSAVLGRLDVGLAAEAGDSDLTLDCTGLAPAGLDGHRPMTVDASLRSVDDDRCWGAGDAVRVAGLAQQRMGCAIAIPMGIAAADNIHAVLARRRPRPFDFGYLFWCVSLGRRDGLIVWVHPDDAPTGRVWTGRRAAVTKELVCRMAVATTRHGGRMYRWPRGPH